MNLEIVVSFLATIFVIMAPYVVMMATVVRLDTKQDRRKK